MRDFFGDSDWIRTNDLAPTEHMSATKGALVVQRRTRPPKADYSIRL